MVLFVIVCRGNGGKEQHVCVGSVFIDVVVGLLSLLKAIQTRAGWVGGWEGLVAQHPLYSEVGMLVLQRQEALSSGDMTWVGGWEGWLLSTLCIVKWEC